MLPRRSSLQIRVTLTISEGRVITKTILSHHPAEPLQAQLTPVPGREAFTAGVFNGHPVAVLYFLGSTMVEQTSSGLRSAVLTGTSPPGRGWLNAIHRTIAPRLSTLTAVGAFRSNEARLLHLSTHDGLTGLANRARFADSVTSTLAASTGLAGMLYVDLDNLKAVNDHLGHRCGDGVLRAVCKRTESTIRSTDLADRLGGDEIGVFCPGIASRAELSRLQNVSAKRWPHRSGLMIRP